MTLTAQDIVNREVLVCVSSLVSTLAAGSYADHGPSYHHTGGDAGRALDALCEQAMELCAPIDDWEEAAIQAGWTKTPEGWWWREPTQEEVEEGVADFYFLGSGPFVRCEDATMLDGLEPGQREVFEHWAVTGWFADKLEAHGEKVERDFAGLTVWARTTTGQAIYADGVIEAICAEVSK